MEVRIQNSNFRNTKFFSDEEVFAYIKNEKAKDRVYREISADLLSFGILRLDGEPVEDKTGNAVSRFMCKRGFRILHKNGLAIKKRGKYKKGLDVAALKEIFKDTTMDIESKKALAQFLIQNS